MTDATVHTLDLSRRGFLRSAGLAAGGAVLIGAALAGPANASAKFSQTMAKYQPTPKGAQDCANCSQFQPADACKVVDGKIASSGWCFLYAQKR